MTFEQQYPDHPDLDPDIEVNGDWVFRSQQEGQCFCGTMTRWCSVSFGLPYCSRKCLDLEWQRFGAALTHANAREMQVAGITILAEMET